MINNLDDNLFNEETEKMTNEEIKESLNKAINQAKKYVAFNVGVAIKSKANKETISAIRHISYSIPDTYLKVKGNLPKTVNDIITLVALIKIHIEDYLKECNLKVDYQLIVITPQGKTIPL